MARVSVEVDLDDFDDDEILDAALDIINSNKGDGYLADQISAIAIALNAVVDEDETLPPPSTASKITSMDDLKRWQQRQVEGLA